MKKAPTSKIKFAPTMKAAASILKITHELISAAKDAGCLAFRTNGSVHVAQLRKWIAEHPGEPKIPNDIPNYREERALSGQSQAIAKMPTVKRPSQPPTREDYNGGVANPNGRTGAQAEAEWSASVALQAEFPTAKSYAAFKRAEARGQIRNFERRVDASATRLESPIVTSTAPVAGDVHAAAWHASAELQREFPTVGSYVAFARANAAGRIRNTVNRRIQ